MAKGLGAGPSSSASLGAVRPMPRPAGLGGVETVSASPKQGGFLARQFGPQGSETRYDMAMQLLQSAMSGAAGSNSPALAFLTPLIGSAVGARATKLRDDRVATEGAAMTEGLLGGPLNEQAQQALEVLNNPDAPDYLKQIAATMFKNNAVPYGMTARGGGSPRRPRGGAAPADDAAKRPSRLYGDPIEMTPGGGFGKVDAAGRWWPIVAAPGVASPVAPVAAAMPPLPADPTLPADPLALHPLVTKYLEM